MTKAAQTAKAIKAELKTIFPGAKFSVTSDNFAGGDSVTVSWIDGPRADKVDGVIRKYQRGHFDGMDDSYKYSQRRDDIPQAKFVSTSRTWSDDKEAEIKAAVKSELGREPSQWESLPEFDGRDIGLESYRRVARANY